MIVFNKKWLLESGEIARGGPSAQAAVDYISGSAASNTDLP